MTKQLGVPRIRWAVLSSAVVLWVAAPIPVAVAAGQVSLLAGTHRRRRCFDKSASAGSDPHGFLADPTLAGRQGAEKQLTDFLKSGGTVVSDPSTPAAPFEVPIVNPGNLNCLHCAEPQTGTGAFPPAASGECL